MTDFGSSKQISGWLWVWSSEVGRYEKMWFVLINGVLAHYTGQEETANTCRGGISLGESVIDFDETCKFVVCQDGEAYHVKAENVEEKQRWVDALINARDQKSQDSISSSTEFGCEDPASASLSHSLMSSTELSLHNQNGKVPCDRDTSPNVERELVKSCDEDPKKNHCGQDGNKKYDKALVTAEDLVPAQMRTFRGCYNSSNACVSAQNMEPQIANTTGHIIQIENHHDERQSTTQIRTMIQKLKEVQTSNDIVNNCNLEWQKAIIAMENESVQVMSHHAARYQQASSSMTKACIDFTKLAQSYTRQSITAYQSEHEQRVKLEEIIKSLTQVQSKASEATSEDDSLEYFDCFDTNTSESGYADVTLQVYQVVGGTPGKPSRRTRIPDRPNVSDSLWSVLKHCIGNDISKMPLPVSFAEPLSLLQRLTEDFEYADVLDRASECTDTATQIAHVAAFISSSYSTTVGRSGKPFNPLLGETYECDRLSDLGWKSIAEQVSHHPPVAAIYCEGKKWEFWMDQSMKSKFKGTTLTVIPLGECHLSFRNGNRYSWKKPNTSIRNVIVGKLWVEQEGDVDIKCHTSDFNCKVTFISSGWTGENFTLKGVIKDGTGKAVYDIVGKYSAQIEYRPAGSKDPGTQVWKRTEPPADNAKFYSFTLLACQLNEMEDGIAPTDSRLRPDQRLMEEGNFDAANVMKKKLEEFQRANKKETWTPKWFKRETDPYTKTEMWKYGGEYWSCKTKKDWSRCPSHIFSPP